MGQRACLQIARSVDTMEPEKHQKISNPRATWTVFDHDADIGVEGSGSTLSEAFEQAALAMTAVVTDAPVEPNSIISIECRAPDRELLLVDWLNALVFEMATQRMLYSHFEVTLNQNDGWHLQARAWGEAVDRLRHAPAVEVKGATFTELSVSQDPGGTWHARCVLDV